MGVDVKETHEQDQKHNTLSGTTQEKVSVFVEERLSACVFLKEATSLGPRSGEAEHGGGCYSGLVKLSTADRQKAHGDLVGRERSCCFPKVAIFLTKAQVGTQARFQARSAR